MLVSSLFFCSNISVVMGMKESRKKKLSFDSSNYSGDLEEEIDINNHHGRNLFQEEFKYINVNDSFDESKRYVQVPIVFRGPKTLKFIEDLVLYGLIKCENIVNNSILHLIANRYYLKVLRQGDILIYTLDNEDDGQSIDICLMVKISSNGSKLFPGLGKVNKLKFYQVYNSNKKDLINSLQRHFGFKGIDISSDEE